MCKKQHKIKWLVEAKHEKIMLFDAFFMMMVNWFDICYFTLIPLSTDPQMFMSLSNYFSTKMEIDWVFFFPFIPRKKNFNHNIFIKTRRKFIHLSNGFGMTFLISISLTAAAFFSAFSVLWWDLDDAGNVAMLSPLSTSTVATLTSLSTPIGSLKFQLNCSNFFLGIFTNLSTTSS